MKYLVTGASGFIGQHLCRHMDEISADYRSCVRTASSSHDFSCPDLLTFTNWSELFKDIDVVVHLAAKVHDMKREITDKAYQEVNVDLSLNLAKQAKKNGVKRFVFLSTIKVNGEKTSSHPFRADSEPSPQDPYAKSKLQAETQLLQLNCPEFEIIIIRPSLVYGANVKANFSQLVRLVKLRLPLPFGLIDNKRSFISVYNLVDLIITAARHPKAGGHIFLASDKHDLSTPELIRHIANSLKIKACLIPIPPILILFLLRLLNMTRYADRLFNNLQVDIKKTEEILAWTPPFTVSESLELMLRND